MKFQTTKININPETPVKQAGYAQQVNPISEVHDPLYARVLMIVDDFGKRFIHCALDNLGAPRSLLLQVKEELENQWKMPVALMISCTHTHFAPDMKNEGYRNQVKAQLIKTCLQMQPVEGRLQCSFIRRPFKGIGNSRITQWETDDIYAQALSFYQDGKRVASLLIHNCHPTILNGETPYFTAEYPGVTLRTLQQQYPDEYFAFLQGAPGDVSTRFTRHEQTWNQVEEFGKAMATEFSSLLQQMKPETDCCVDYQDVWVQLKHHVKTPDEIVVPDFYSQREKDTLQYGIDRNAYTRQHPEMLAKETLVSVLKVGQARLVFSEYELFSEYNQAMNDHAALVCYSQGYSHYVSGPSFDGLTYETLQDTLSDETKQELTSLFSKLAE